MKVFPDLKIPTPFGSVNLPGLETPPLSLPSMPDSHARKAIAHSIGEDASQIIAFIPWVGDIAADIISDLHYAEIVKTLTPDEYRDFTQYNKIFPSAIAMARTLLFKEVKTAKELPKAAVGLLPMAPANGPPLPRALGVKWPGKPEKSRS